MTAAGFSTAMKPEIRKQARKWLATAMSGDITSSEQAALTRWREADTEHEQAWQQVQRLGRTMQPVPPALNATLRAPPARNLRRTVLRCLAGLSAAGIAGYAVHEGEPWQRLSADARTAGNTRRALTLPDGTLVNMNADTAIDIRFDAERRRVILHSGEIVVTTAHETGPDRPFSVVTPQGSVQAPGGRFSVRRLDGAWSRTSVYEGEVEIHPSANPDAMRSLLAGQGARFDAHDVQATFDADTAETAWIQGLLVADRMRLADFLAELARYRPGILRCDPAVADMSVSGVYPLRDTDMVLETLKNALPIEVSRVTRYWTSVRRQ